jgi:hypothetical protein
VPNLLDSDKIKPQGWLGPLRVTLRIGLIIGAVFLGTNIYERISRPTLRRETAPTRKIHPDLYVYPPRSYVSDARSARKLIGKELWIKEGYRWSYQPGDGVLGPLEKIVPTSVRQAGSEVRLAFKKEGKTFTILIGAGGQFFVDEIFFLKDPRELFSHWSDEDWQKVDARQVEAGMSEYQVVFAVGAGKIIESTMHSTVRIVDYELGADKGIAPIRVTYRDGVAERVDPLIGK